MESAKSEWEELEKLTKDELIIELVRARWRFRNLQKVILELSSTMGDNCLFEPGEKPSKEWAEKIAEYAFRNGPESLYDWGIDWDTANRLFDEHFDADDVSEEKEKGIE